MVCSDICGGVANTYTKPFFFFFKSWRADQKISIFLAFIFLVQFLKMAPMILYQYDKICFSVHN